MSVTTDPVRANFIVIIPMEVIVVHAPMGTNSLQMA